MVLSRKEMNEALAEAEAAVALAPDSVTTQSALGDALTALNRAGEARPVYQRALECQTGRARIPVELASHTRDEARVKIATDHGIRDRGRWPS